MLRSALRRETADHSETAVGGADVVSGTGATVAFFRLALVVELTAVEADSAGIGIRAIRADLTRRAEQRLAVARIVAALPVGTSRTGAAAIDARLAHVRVLEHVLAVVGLARIVRLAGVAEVGTIARLDAFDAKT